MNPELRSRLAQIVAVGQPHLGMILSKFKCDIAPCRGQWVLGSVLGEARYLGTVELYVPSRSRPDVLYEFSDMILHFIDEHAYVPPAEFIDSVVHGDLGAIPILEPLSRPR